MRLLPPKPKTVRHVFLTAAAFDQIAEIASNRGDDEIGGVLVGYATEDDALVVTDASGPGPRGKCTPHTVRIDGRYATEFCAIAAKSTHGATQYLGDWHVHTTASAEPSSVDMVALKKLPKLNAWNYPIFSLVLNCSLNGYACIFRQGLRTRSLDCSIID
jgi:integrative and conjugative element protein (TIGR02256 family)